MLTTTATAPVPPPTHRAGDLVGAWDGPAAWGGLAAESGPVYRPGAGPEVPGNVDAPFGLPVLAELPELAQVLEELVAADRAALRAIAGLAQLLTDDQVATRTGVSVEGWIGIVARHTRMDRRLALATARLLHRLPTLHAAVTDQQLSWPQLRGLTLTLRDAPRVLDGQLDAFLARLLPHLPGTDPDTLVQQVRRALTEYSAQLAPDPAEGPASNHLHLQPRLDGTGGRITGELDAVGLAIVDDATAPTRDQLDHPSGHGGARADNLLTRLTHTCHPQDQTAHDTTDHPAATEATTESTPEGEADATAGATTDGTAGGPGEAADRQPARPLPAVKLLLRCNLEDLLDTTRTPTDLLTRLVGGSLRLTSSAARRLLDTRGVELRSIIVDHGEILGVGRTTRMPPGWLRDLALAIHDTCTGPLCDRPALGAELDHARPWHPTRPGEPAGTTDIDNLGPLCATTNRAKETAGWHAHQRPDGRRTWTHPRTGLRITSLPATWRPPPTPPPQQRPPTDPRHRDGPD
jgi:hypothetical protein